MNSIWVWLFGCLEFWTNKIIIAMSNFLYMQCTPQTHENDGSHRKSHNAPNFCFCETWFQWIRNEFNDWLKNRKKKIDESQVFTISNTCIHHALTLSFLFILFLSLPVDHSYANTDYWLLTADKTHIIRMLLASVVLFQRFNLFDWIWY